MTHTGKLYRFTRAHTQPTRLAIHREKRIATPPPGCSRPRLAVHAPSRSRQRVRLDYYEGGTWDQGSQAHWHHYGRFQGRRGGRRFHVFQRYG